MYQVLAARNLKEMMVSVEKIAEKTVHPNRSTSTKKWDVIMTFLTVRDHVPRGIALRLPLSA
jgi:hypothetical protein